MTTKVCSKCNVEKPLDQFYLAPRYRLGVSGHCKACKGLYAKIRNSDPLVKENDRKVRRMRDRSEEHRKYREKYPEKCKAKYNKWRIANMARAAEKSARYRAAKLNATPPWLSAIELAQIQEMYDIADAKTMQTGVKYHVDHIHPLQGDGFTGLHVPWNLQILTALENKAKNNRPPVVEKHLFWESLL